MLLDYACGGELITLLRREGRFANDVALFFATEIALGNLLRWHGECGIDSGRHWFSHEREELLL